MATERETKSIPLLDLGALHQPLRGELEAACREVIDSGHFILGPNVSALEREIADYCGAPAAVGVASGTDAIHLALRASGIGPGDEVITTPFTFCATADSVMLAGARPVFADIDPVSFNIDPAAVEAALTARTRAIIAVHLYGQPADMKALRAIADDNRLVLIEDNAQALGAKLDGSRTGSLGDLAAISFFPSKNLGCFGDGGMVVAADEESAQRLKSLRAHGTTRKYFSTELGLNSRLDEMQAAILRVKLPHLDGWNARRRENARLYSSILAGNEGIIVPEEAAGFGHIYHQYTVRVAGRDRVQQELRDAGIATAVYYPVPLHHQPLFAEAGFGEGSLPAAEKACAEVISLPVGPELAAADIERITAALIAATGAR
ncbi:MAG: DegT/DnrJ/EryC1/StrS family aminotransferase [Thermoleophilia bacterium]